MMQACWVPDHTSRWLDKTGGPVLMELDASALRGGWVVRCHAGREKQHGAGCRVRQALEPRKGFCILS